MPHVYVDMEGFNDHDLIDELQERGYRVIDPDDEKITNLIPYEAETLLSMIDVTRYKTGSPEHLAIQKLWDIYFGRGDGI